MKCFHRPNETNNVTPLRDSCRSALRKGRCFAAVICWRADRVVRRLSGRWAEMKPTHATILLSIVAITSCGDTERSQLVVLYKSSVSPGNSVVSFVNHNDESGQLASVHCEELRRVYEAKEGIRYICSTVVFDEFKPTIK